MIDRICDYSKCSGCSVCANTCPVNAIEMIPGKIGHIYPVINKQCIECLKCVNTCPVNKPVELQTPKKALAFWIKDAEEHRTSSSGGAAACFTNFYLNNGGIVYGCAALPLGIISFIRVDNKDDAYRLKGSKYVHGHINDIYETVNTDLKSGKKVLFIGLPCQVAGLRNYIKKNDENLVAIDLICHGVPSQKVLFEYLGSLGFKREELLSLSFREPKGFYLSIKSRGNKTYHRDECEDLYYMAFNDNLCFRDSCFTCRYATQERVGDLTIGDFWGLGKKKPFSRDTNGNVSCVLINNTKGQRLMDLCADQYEAVERTIEEAVAGNKNLRRPSVSKNAEKFQLLYGNIDIQKALKKCLWKRRMKSPLIKILKSLLER